MATASDSILANVTAALKRRAMYKNTLIVHLSDNVRPRSPPSLNPQAEERHFTHQCPCDDMQQGGPVGACCGAHHANNWPLRGPHCAFRRPQVHATVPQRMLLTYVWPSCRRWQAHKLVRPPSWHTSASASGGIARCFGVCMYLAPERSMFAHACELREGGIRVVAFASGGFIPPPRRGLVLSGMVHNSDWCSYSHVHSTRAVNTICSPRPVAVGLR